MLQQFCLDFKLYKEDFIGKLMLTLVAFLGGFLLLIVFSTLDEEFDAAFCMGTLTALIITFYFSFFLGALYRQEFALALSMGRTRKTFMLSYALRQFLCLFISFCMILLLYQLESAVYQLMYPVYIKMPFDYMINDWSFILIIILAVIPCMVLLSMFFGAIYSYYGKNAAAVLYFLYIFSILIAVRIMSYEPGDDGLLDQVAQGINRIVQIIPTELWIIIGIAIIVAMLMTVIRLGRKQMVR